MPQKISCREAGFECDFEVQSENEDEVIDFAREHAAQAHEMDLSRSDVREYVQTV